jgi:hypothetical protein
LPRAASSRRLSMAQVRDADYLLTSSAISARGLRETKSLD